MPIAPGRLPPPALVAFGLAPPPEESKFLSTAFPAVDSILSGLRDYPQPHPLKDLVFETSMLLRELLQTWSHLNQSPEYRKSAHLPTEIGDPAYESLISRNQRVLSHLTDLAQDARAKHSGSVEVQTVSKGKETAFTAAQASVHFYLLHLRSEKKFKTLDLRNLIRAEALHTANAGAAEFSISLISSETLNSTRPDGGRVGPFQWSYVLDSTNVNFHRPALEVYNFRTSNSLDRARWLAVFQYYINQNKANSLLYSQYTVRERIALYQTCLFRPYGMDGERLESSIKRNEYLFSTPADRLTRLDSAFSFRERFFVCWFQKLGANRLREVEFEFTAAQPLIRIFKVDPGVTSSQTNFSYNNKLEIVLQPSDLIDFALNIDANEVDFTFTLFNVASEKGRKHHRRFVFDSAQACQRFFDLLLAVEALANAEFQHKFHFVNEDVLLGLRCFKPPNSPEQADVDTSAELYRSPLQQLFQTMLAASPTSQLVQTLFNRAAQLPLTYAGECERLQLLFSRLTALAEKSNAYHASSFTSQSSRIHDYLACDCPITAGRAQQVASNPCLLFFLQTLIHCDGLRDLMYYCQFNPIDETGPMNPQFTALQQTAFKLLYFIYQSRHCLPLCRCRLDSLCPDAVFSPLVHLPFHSLVTQFFYRRSLQEPLMSTLFDLLIGDLESTGAARTGGFSQVLAKSIKDAALVPLILHSACRAAPSAASMAVKNFLLLLSPSGGNPVNFRSFLDQLSWQNWILPLLLEVKSAMDQQQIMAQMESDTLPAQESSDSSLVSLSMSLLSSLLYQSLNNENRDRSKDKERDRCQSLQIYRTMEMLIEYYGWNHEISAMFKVILVCLLNLIKSRAREFTGNYSIEAKPKAYENFFYLVDTVDDFIFYRPTEVANQAAAAPTVASVDAATVNQSGAADSAPDSPERTVVALHYDRSLDGRSQGYLIDIVLIDRLLECILALKLIPPKEGVKLEDWTGEKDKLNSKAEKKLLKHGFIEGEFWRTVKQIFLEMQKANAKRDVREQDRLGAKLTAAIQKREKDLDRAGGFFSFGSKTAKFAPFQAQIDPRGMKANAPVSKPPAMAESAAKGPSSPIFAPAQSPVQLSSAASTTASTPSHRSTPSQFAGPTFASVKTRRPSAVGMGNSFQIGTEWSSSEGSIRANPAGEQPTVNASFFNSVSNAARSPGMPNFDAPDSASSALSPSARQGHTVPVVLEYGSESDSDLEVEVGARQNANIWPPPPPAIPDAPAPPEPGEEKAFSLNAAEPDLWEAAASMGTIAPAPAPPEEESPRMSLAAKRNAAFAASSGRDHTDSMAMFAPPPPPAPPKQ